MRARASRLMPAALLTGALWAGCASVGAPVAVWHDAPPPLAAPAPADTTRPQLTIETRRHDGVMLRLQAPQALVQRADALEIIRQADDAPPETLQRVALTDALRARLVPGGLALLDRRVTTPQTLRYALHLRAREATVGTSPTATIRWQPTPEPPTLRAQALTPRAVSLQWVPRAGWGLAIYRRALGGRWQRVATAPATAGGMWIDRDLTPGSVYVYRVAAHATEDDIPTLGRLGREVYVTVEGAPPH